MVNRKLVLSAVVLAIPITYWLSRGDGPSPELTRMWAWAFRGLTVVAVGVEVARRVERRSELGCKVSSERPSLT